MKLKFLKVSTILMVGITACFYSCNNNSNHGHDSGGSGSNDTVVVFATNKELAYRNSVNKAPHGYNGPTYQLSHNYPTAMPSSDKLDECKWLKVNVDFKARSGDSAGVWTKGWTEYANHVKDYVVNGINLDDTNYSYTTDWYNLPWLAVDDYTGREFTHGGRYSFSVPLTQVDPLGKDSSDNCLPVWGIASYNCFGGYAIGQMWSSDGEIQFQADPKSNQVIGMPFPDGTVIHKINMIGHLGDAPPSHLKGAPTWKLNVHTQDPNCNTFSGTNARSLQDVHLFEMDIMVKDSRAPNGWVFIALVYDQSQKDNPVMWDKYTVMGIQYGMDSKSYPAVTQAEGQPVSQTLLNSISQNWTVGCNGRLATFQGTPNQNCMGCHQTAFFQKETGDRAYQLLDGVKCSDGSTATFPKYFTAWQYGGDFPEPEIDSTKTSVGLDYSLRMFDAVNNYYKYKN